MWFRTTRLASKLRRRTCPAWEFKVMGPSACLTAYVPIWSHSWVLHVPASQAAAALMRVRGRKAKGPGEESSPLCVRVRVWAKERRKKGRKISLNVSVLSVYVFVGVHHLINQHLPHPPPLAAGWAAEAAEEQWNPIQSKHRCTSVSLWIPATWNFCFLKGALCPHWCVLIWWGTWEPTLA